MPEIIAEAGSAHNGDLSLAKELIHAAKESGADRIKFQYIIAEEILHPQVGTLRLFKQDVSLYERFRMLERPPEFYHELKEYCKKKELKFLCSAFGTQSAQHLFDMGIDTIKIASPELNHYELIQQIAEFRLPVILSTGVSTLGDIEETLSFFHTRSECTLLHCVTQYPAREASYNVTCIDTLKKAFNIHIGISDHSEDATLIPSLATLMGATMIEKHFTLSKKGRGLDDSMALEPAQMKALCIAVQQLASLSYEEGMKVMYKEFGKNRVAAALGNGHKILPEEEADIYATTRRSLIAMRDLKAGSYLQKGDLRALRAEQQHHPGLHPRYLSHLMGAKLVHSLKNGEGIQWHHMLERKSHLSTEQ